MSFRSRMCRCSFLIALLFPLSLFAAKNIPSIIVFGDSMSDIGNTTHLLKSLRKEESPSYLVAPARTYIIRRMTDFADDYHVPQFVLDAGIEQVTYFFDFQLAPMLAEIVGKVKKLPTLPGKPYWNNRFSNGRVWFEYLAPMLDIDTEEHEAYINKAFGGSWAMMYNDQLTVWNFIKHPILTLQSLVNGKLIPPSLGLIVQAYLMENGKLNSDSMYFIYSANNDYLSALMFDDVLDPDIQSGYINNVLNDVNESIRKLYEAGARRFVIIGISHIGDTPRFVFSNEKNILNKIAETHNEGLKAKIAEWQEKVDDIEIMYFDSQSVFQKALDEPSQYGYTNVTDACIDVNLPTASFTRKNSAFQNNYVLQYVEALQHQSPQFASGQKNYKVCSNPSEYLFWDQIHPATSAHQYLAFEICHALELKGYKTHCKWPKS